MKTLRKYGFIVSLMSELGVLLVFVISQAQWFLESTLIVKISTLVFIFSMMAALGYYIGLRWQQQ